MTSSSCNTTGAFDYTENKSVNGQTSRTFKAKGNLGVYIIIWGDSPKQIDRIDAMFPLTPGQQAMNKVSFMTMRSLEDHIFGEKSQAITDKLITAMESSKKTEATHKFIAEGVLVSAGTIDFPGEGLLVILSYNLPKEDDKQKYGAEPRPDPKYASQAKEQGPVARQSRQSNSFSSYRDTRFGYSIEYPADFKVTYQNNSGDSNNIEFTNGEAQLYVWGRNNLEKSTTKQYYDNAMFTIGSKNQIGYNQLGDTWFVITYRNKDTITYRKTLLGPGSHNSFMFSYPVAKKQQYDYIVTYIEKSFKRGNTDIEHW